MTHRTQVNALPRRVQGFAIPDRDYEDLRTLARRRGESMSFILREALRAYLRENLPERCTRDRQDTVERRAGQ